MLVLLFVLWQIGASPKVVVTVLLFVAGAWLWTGFAVRERVVRPLQTIANMVAGLREEDFSLRARGGSTRDDLGLALLELNALGETLRQQRLGALEATALLRRVMVEIDVAVFAFDEQARLRLVNRAGAQLLGTSPDRLQGRLAEELGLAPFLVGEAVAVREHIFAGRAGRFGMRRSSFRQGGRRHTLLVLADVSRALREEERQAWQRLIRVLGHEINNSLAPIKSVTQSLRDRLARGGPEAAMSADLGSGLELIGARAEALSRFMGAYAKLARLPLPRPAPLDVEAWVHRVVALETRLPVEVLPGEPLTFNADGDQLDQLLINLVRNAADAVTEKGRGAVSVAWSVEDGQLRVRVLDEGPGIPSTGNLFVPFFTTKRNGSGIGLVLSRQIAEAHGGTLTLANREGAGCEALLTIPTNFFT